TSLDHRFNERRADGAARQGEDAGEDANAENDMANRPCCHNSRALIARLETEAVRLPLIRCRAELVTGGGARGMFSGREFHTAAERYPAHLPARAMSVVPAEDPAAKTDGEGIHLHAKPAGHGEMAKLMEKHHDGQHKEKGNEIAPERLSKASNPEKQFRHAQLSHSDR